MTTKKQNAILNNKFLILILITVCFASFVSAVSWTGNNITYAVTEDTPYVHNFTANITNPVAGMSFAVDTIGQVVLKNGIQVSYPEISSWIYFTNSTLGLFLLNATNDTETGNFSIPIKVSYSGGLEGITTSFYFNISARNDPPYFLNLGGARVVNKSGINLNLSATDEELDLNYTFNVSFPSCVHTALNPPTGPNNCTLFNLTYFNATTTNISFVPQGNQKGEYEINFSVKDFRNATYSTIVNWTVSWNDAPFFVYTCNNERNTTEDSPFTSCRINASDTDELHNLTFTTNYAWFTFNNSIQNITIGTGSTGNASALLNFTPADSQVGNWSINLTVTDTGAPNASIESNSTVFYFYIANKNDSVAITNIPNKTVYTSSTSEKISINATDDDLLIPDKRVYNESLTFSSDNSSLTIVDYLTPPGSNITYANISFNPNSLGTGNHTVNITVRDANNYSIASAIFTINVLSNDAPQWNSTMATNFNLTEGAPFYANFSKNVTDTDSLNFFIETLSAYEFSATINQNTGVMNFTPTDADVGLYTVRITATDGKTPSTKDFNFTVNNVNDAPTFLQLVVQNGTLANGLINVSEDVPVEVDLQIRDDDLLIKQPDFYSESLALRLNLTGRNSSLLQFGLGEHVINNISQFTSFFTPKKSDVGNYNMTINVTDKAGNSTIIRFNLTVSETLHAPVLIGINNADLSILNETFYLDVNATDVEDGSDGINGNLTFRIQNLTASGNFLRINASTGVINFTTNSTLAGRWQYNLTVNDTSGTETSQRFNITIYDFPKILLPNSTYTFNFKENTSFILNFTANHTVQDPLNYTLTINGIIKNSTLGNGNASGLLWSFTPNFTMETDCSGAVNLTLNVSNSKLSNSTNWLVTINNTNYPLSFISDIPDQSGNTPLTLALSDYFFDVDSLDTCLNQTIGFVYRKVDNSASGGVMSVAIVNQSGNGTSPSATFSVKSEGSANFSLTAFEYNVSDVSQALSNITSNNFSVSLKIPDVASGQSPASTGGSTRTQILSLKILVPKPVSAKQKDKLIIPLGLENDGNTQLNQIYLGAAIAKDGVIRNDLIATFDQPYFDKLAVHEKENVTMIVDIDTSSTGLFEVTINATVKNPVYSDWTKFYIQIEEDKAVLEKIVFSEEFVIGNPLCAELADLTNEAKKLYNEGKSEEALAKANEAVEACSKAITQPPGPRLSPSLGNTFIGYTAIASLVAFALGFAYYIYKKVSLNKKLNGLDGLGKI